MHPTRQEGLEGDNLPGVIVTVRLQPQIAGQFGAKGIDV